MPRTLIFTKIPDYPNGSQSDQDSPPPLVRINGTEVYFIQTIIVLKNSTNSFFLSSCKILANIFLCQVTSMMHLVVWEWALMGEGVYISQYERTI